MAEITAISVKKLRDRTGAGIMDCKKALIKANGSIELAIENMRKSSAIKAAKKVDNTTIDGIIATRINGSYGFILEVNCQTDFVTKNNSFKVFVNKIIDFAVTNRIVEVEVLKTKFEEERIALIAKIGENINIHRLAFLKGEMIGAYQHGTRIGVLVAAKGSNNEKLMKQLAMHIAASKPEFIKPEDVPIEMIKKEYQIQLDIAMQSSKSKEIVEKIVEGRIKKFTDAISLNNQPFIMEPNKLIAQLLKEHDVDVTNFIRFEVGENTKKVKTNFAAEITTISKQY